MPAVDRTSAFLSIVAGLSQHAPPRPRAPAPAPRALAGTSEASRCKERIQRAERDLQRLRALQASGAGVFDDDSSGQEADLSASIQQDLAQISKMVQAVSSTATDQHSAGILSALNSSAMKLTQDFATVLRQKAEREDSTMSHRKAFGEASSGLRARRVKGSLHVGHDLWGGQDQDEDEDDSCVISLPSAQQMQQQMQNQRPQQRLAAVEGAQKLISELAGSFQQMTGLVAQQGELLSSIDQNMDQSVDNIETAQANLAKFLDGITGNRPLLLKTFAVLIGFALFFVIFLR